MTYAVSSVLFVSPFVIVKSEVVFYISGYDIISSKPEILYASGGIHGRAKYIVKTHMANYIMI